MPYPVAAVRGHAFNQAAAAAAWSPTDLAALEAWWDFSDATALWEDTGGTDAVDIDGDFILRADDKSGNGYHVTEATNGPTYKTGIQNGLSIARFDGTDDSLFRTGISTLHMAGFTIAAVFNPVTSVTNDGVFSLALTGGTDWGSADGFNLSQGPTANKIKVERDSILSAAVTHNTNTWHIALCRYGSTVKLYSDGGAPVTDATVTTTDLDPNRIMFSARMTAPESNWGENDIGEIVMVSGELDVTDSNLLGNYLADKWGLTWTDIS